jgi:hypothetical protein
VAVDVAAPLSPARARSRFLARVAAIPANAVLAAIVGISIALRQLAALAHVTPYLVPDEYYYNALARSIATTGHPLIRGHAAHFPALLTPIVTAPFQWFDPETAYRLTQSFDVVVMSLAAVPAFALARRLGFGEAMSLACAAVTVAAPGLFYAGFMLSEPVAYPLALAAVYAGVRALDEPSRRTQLAFLVWSGLATFTRAQYVVLPLAFAGAALVLERLRAFRTWRLTAFVLVGGGVVALALGPARLAGVYAGGAKGHWAAATVLAWIAKDAMLLAYTAGWVIVPGALAGLFSARTRVERAFAAFVGLLAGALLVQAGWIAGIDRPRFEERYLMVLVPLLAMAFVIWARRGAPRKLLVVVASCALVLFSVRVPLSGFVVMHGKDGSPTLGGVVKLEGLVGTANGALIVALVAAALSICSVAIAYRPRFAAAGIGLALATLIAISTLAYSFDRQSARTMRQNVLPADARWVDHTGLKNVGLLNLPGSERGRALSQLFWNRSITDLFRLGADTVDGYAQPNVHVSDDGRILVPGGTFVGPLLVQTVGSRAVFSGATKVASANGFDLWRPDPRGVPRLAMLAGGIYANGWLSWQSFVSLWPDASGRVEGTLRLRMWLPRGVKPNAVTVRAPGYARTVRLEPGGTAQTIQVPVSHRGPWTVKLSAANAMYLGAYPVSVLTSPPVFTRTSGSRVACVAPAAGTTLV